MARTAEDGPAQRAGIKAGDVILSFDKKAINETRMLPSLVVETGPGKTVKVELWRDRQLRSIWVTLGELDDLKNQAPEPNQDRRTRLSKEAASDDFFKKFFEDKGESQLAGMTLRPRAGKGVVIALIAEGSVADAQGFRKDDIILSVDREERIPSHTGHHGDQSCQGSGSAHGGNAR